MAKGKGQSKGHEAPPAAMSFLQVFETGSGQDRPSRIGRPYSDQFDVAAVSAAIAAGETTPLKAYQTYAATAGRPYARSSFEQLWRNHARRAGGAEQSEVVPAPRPASDAELYIQSEAFWAEHVAPKPSRVLTLTSDNVALRVKGGGLQIADGERHLYFAPSAQKPNAIVLSGWGGLVTVEALRFCDDYKVALVVLDWMHGLMSVTPPNPKASAALVRAQCAANAVAVAQGLVEEKIRNSHVVGGLRAEDAARFIGRARRGQTVAEVMQAEAHAAKVNFTHIPIEMRWRPGGPPVLAAWKRYVTRSRAINEHSARRATHPINALLNVAATVAAGRLTAQLAARGACLSIGFLHADKPGRFSLTYDAIEPLRPFIEAKTFGFLARHQFAASDFLRVKGSNELRIMDNLLAAFAQETALSERAIQAAADFVLALIQSNDPRACPVPSLGQGVAAAPHDEPAALAAARRLRI